METVIQFKKLLKHEHEKRCKEKGNDITFDDFLILKLYQNKESAERIQVELMETIEQLNDFNSSL